MCSYDTYLNSDEGGRHYIMRTMFEEHRMMQQAINTLAQEIQELRERKGVSSHLKLMGQRSKPPNFIA